MVFYWWRSNSKSPQVSRPLLNILSDLNNVVVWMVSTRSLIFKSSSPFNNHSVAVLRALITIRINVTSMFHSFFRSLARSRYLSFFFTFFQFYSVVNQDSKIHNCKFSLFCWLLWGLVEIKWSVWIFIIIIIIIHSLELFTSALAGGFSLESEWQQVSSSLQDSS